MVKKTILICEDSKEERIRFYERQFDNFDIYGVSYVNGEFIETDPIDSPEKLHQKILELKNKNRLPDLVVLDLFYKRPRSDVDSVEKKFVERIENFKIEFRNIKKEVLTYLEPAGVDALERIRKVDGVSEQDLPIYVYTDKNFNFLPTEEFNKLYELDPGFLFKDRDDDIPRSQIPKSSEYFRLSNAINRVSKPKAVFISHGHSLEWLKVQRFIEKEVNLETIELEQQISRGDTIFGKLVAYSKKCSFAVIVMSADDSMSDNSQRARENVIHEIGYFQGLYGSDRVVILHEDGVSIPSNLSGVVYLGYRRGDIQSTFETLRREILS